MSRRTDRLRFLPGFHRVVHQVGLLLEGVGEPPLNQAEAVLLARLAESDATVGELHAAFAHKRSTLTSILDRIVERGLATRETSEVDRRTSVVRLTRVGRRLAESVHERLRAVERSVGGEERGSEMATFLRVLDRLEEALAAAGEGPEPSD